MGQSGGDMLSQGLNVLTNIASAGLVGYEGGRFGAGMTTRGVGEAIGEVTGRNASRDALYEQRVRLDKEVEARRVQNEEELSRRRMNDVMASNAAGAIRNDGASDIRNIAMSSLTRDFLGM